MDRDTQGRQEPLCLHTLTVAAPGERKSEVQKRMVRPIRAAERELGDESSPVRVKALAQKKVADERAKQLTLKAGKANDADRADTERQAIRALTDAEAIAVPAIFRITADDVTPEAAGSLLAEQGGRLAIISAEGGIFEILAGRYSNKPNLDLFLKGHAGHPYSVDRIGRGAMDVPHAMLTVGLMVQPAVLKAIAANRDFHGRGLLARIPTPSRYRRFRAPKSPPNQSPR